MGLTIANVREDYWIPRLRRLVEKMIRQRYGCKRYQAVALEVLPQGLLPLERTQGSGAFEVDGVDFTGPIKYRKSSRMGRESLFVVLCVWINKSLISGVNTV